jgi:hypothetical protein
MKALTDGGAADRTGDLPVVDTLVEEHVGSGGRVGSLGTGGEAYIADWISTKTK